MNFSEETALKKIEELKHEQFGSVAIDATFGDVKYKLLLLTAGCENDTKIMELLSRWRKENEFWFPAIFKVTVEGTIRWFQNGVIGLKDRLLFIIKTGDDYIGHVGLYRFDFDSCSCELDNIMRGEKPYPGIIHNALEHLMEWGRDTLGLKTYTLETASDNDRSLKLYKGLGFVEFKREPLMRIEKEDRIEWEPAPADYNKKIERYNVFMKLKD